MRFIGLLALAALVAAAPAPEPISNAATIAARTLGNHGSYSISGLGNRKKELTACGANSLDMAIAMLETNNMRTSDYPYGDNKQSDSANFGIFKQNWGMLRGSTSRYRGKLASDYNIGAELNNNLCLDIQLRHESQNYYGESLWMAGHRNGATGLSNPNTQDIQNYKDAIYWIRSQLTGTALTNDVRYWVEVPPI
jgi:hypothetical protein